MNKELKETIEKNANELGWETMFSEYDDSICIEFENYTPAGQDLIVSITIHKNDGIDALRKELYEYSSGFDVDEQISLWIDESGHGKNGAPYRMKDILADMETAEEMIERLACEI